MKRVHGRYTCRNCLTSASPGDTHNDSCLAAAINTSYANLGTANCILGPNNVHSETMASVSTIHGAAHRALNGPNDDDKRRQTSSVLEILGTTCHRDHSCTYDTPLQHL